MTCRLVHQVGTKRQLMPGSRVKLHARYSSLWVAPDTRIHMRVRNSLVGGCNTSRPFCVCRGEDSTLPTMLVSSFAASFAQVASNSTGALCTD
mmetsp:Transcript_82979/g.209177  ORF Transcript_82979/g.209177 Transcript_82979/m.209177 type:complete len:93 (-) Transcript_82979:20-298(-)